MWPHLVHPNQHLPPAESLWVCPGPATFLLKIAHSRGDLDPHLIHFPWAHWSPYQKWHVNRFSRFAQLTAECPYTLQWTTPFPLKTAPSYRESGPHLIHHYPGPSDSTSKMASHPKQHLNWFSPVFCRSHHCDRLTNHASPSVTIGCIYVLYSCNAA